MTEREQLEQAIAALEAQRTLLGDLVVDTSQRALRDRVALLAAHPSLPEAAQRKQVTILFADVSGFTALAETMDPEEVSELINSLWLRLDGAILAHGGIVDKHIGDAVMALFGAPAAHEDDPERAIQAALAMQTHVLEFNEANAGSGSPVNLAMRIGIHTGPVLLGLVGTTVEYTAMGDTVNLASRLEHFAPLGGILISYDTYRHVRGLFEVQAIPPLSVKGRSHPVNVYVVRGQNPRSFTTTTRGLEGLHTRMVGRAGELRRLVETLYSVMEEGHGRLVTLYGEAGVGKSRLLLEFNEWLTGLPESITVFKARTDEQSNSHPYSLLRDLFARHWGILESDRAAVARDKFQAGFMTAFSQDRSDGVRVDEKGNEKLLLEKSHFVGQLLGLDFTESPYLKGALADPPQIQTRAFHYAVQFFDALGTFGSVPGFQSAIVLFFEDIHWADEGSLNLIEYLARECRAPLFILCLTRPTLFERRPSWGQTAPHPLRLELAPLSTVESRTLVGEILRKLPAIPSDLEELIVNGAEGNPFYMEELTQMLVDGGIILPGPAEWQLVPGRLEGLSVPATLTGVLQARLDSLPPLERETLQRAAVVGQVFWDSAVRTLAANSPISGEMPAVFGALRTKQLIHGRAPSVFAEDREFTFKHAILQQVTYESVLKRLRRAYHARVARWLIERSGERAAEYAGLIAEHFERAGEIATAARWYSQAARQAREASASAEAAGYYEKALAFAPSEAHAERVELFEGWGEMLVWQAHYEQAGVAYAAMQQAAEAVGDAVAQARAFNGLSRVHDSQGDYRAALAAAARAEEIAEAAGASLELARTLAWKGLASIRLGRPDSALELGNRALALSTESANRRVMADSYNLLGYANMVLARFGPATESFEQALELYRTCGDRPGVGNILYNLGITAGLRGDYATALLRCQEALQIARDIGYREREMLYVSLLTKAQIELGDYAAAERELRQVIRMSEILGERFSLAYSYVFLAEALLGQGQLGEALGAAQRGLELGQGAEQPDVSGRAWRVLGMIGAHSRQAPLNPRACFEASLRTFTDMNAEGERGRTLLAWSRFEFEQGNVEQAKSMRLEAESIFVRLGIEVPLSLP